MRPHLRLRRNPAPERRNALPERDIGNAEQPRDLAAVMSGERELSHGAQRGRQAGEPIAEGDICSPPAERGSGLGECRAILHPGGFAYALASGASRAHGAEMREGAEEPSHIGALREISARGAHGLQEGVLQEIFRVIGMPARARSGGAERGEMRAEYFGG
jgi:hypothetical protein